MTLRELITKSHNLGVDVHIENSADERIVSFEIFHPHKSFENGDRIGHNVPFEKTTPTAPKMFDIAFADMLEVLSDEPVNPENMVTI